MNFEQRLREKAEREAAEAAAETPATPEPGNGDTEKQEHINLGDSKEMAGRILSTAEYLKNVGLAYEAGTATDHAAIEALLRGQFITLLALGSSFARMAQAESQAVLAQTMRGFRVPPLGKG